MTAGQKAMAYAFIYPEPTKLKRAGSSKLEDRVLSGRLSEARAIRLWSRTKATDVLNGALPFDQVLKEMNGEAEKSLGKHGGDRRSDRVKDQGHNVTLKRRGNATAYVLARLKRDHPDIAARLAAGEFPSARAAAYILARLDRNRPDLAALIGLSVRAMNAAGSATASAAAVGPIIRRRHNPL